MSRLLPAVLAAAHLAERTGLEVEQEDVEFYASVYPRSLPRSATGEYSVEDLDYVASHRLPALTEVFEVRRVRKSVPQNVSDPAGERTTGRSEGGGCSHREYRAGQGMGKCPSCKRRMTQYGR